MEFTPSQTLQLEYMKACVRVAAHARMFAWTTDHAPLIDLTFDQGVIWDDLTAAISVLEELEAEAR